MEIIENRNEDTVMPQKGKDSIRKKYIKIRNNILNKKEKYMIICEKIIKLEEYKKSKVIALYHNLKNEVETSFLIENSLKNNKIVVLPKVVENDLCFYKLSSKEEVLKKSIFGVLEPFPNKEKEINPSEIDLVIVPGICFDTNKNRLGFGKGYYDRFLNKYSSKTIGICFEEQILKEGILPTTNEDYQMNKIITEKRNY